ncbi:non-heme iron oxygenase ferredoxin subunit [Pseudomonadota bacterium]
MAEWIDVARVDEITPGNRKIISTDLAEIAVFNLDGEFFAIEDVCTHDGGELATGACEGDQIICPRHGARFCIRNGKVLSPPAYEDIETFPVRIDQDVVQINIE